MRRSHICLMVVALCLVQAFLAAAARAEPIDIGSRLELFVDEHLIAQWHGGAKLELHHPIEREVVFVCDQPWEGNWSGMATFIQEEATIRMYYRAANWSPRRSHVGYAESTDGIHWTRPNLGLVAYNGSKRNNIILPGSEIISFVPFKDANPACKPGERFKAIAAKLKPVRGLYAYASEDGIHWRQLRQDPLITKGYFDSQNVAFWDTARGQYVAYFREMRGPNGEMHPEGPQLGIDPEGGARDVLTATSPDFFDWTEPEWLEYPGAPREQLYLNQIQPYHRAPHLLIGFPGRFMAAREIEAGLPITEHPSYRYGGIAETLFMSSRDGKAFNRWGEAFIRPGPRRERWIYGNTFPNYGLVVTEADTAGAPPQLSMYIQDGGGWTTEGTASRFRRCTMRMDGFVSVNAPLEGGGFTTKPLRFTGEVLRINFSTSAAGSIRVEIQDAEGNPYEGFALADCPDIFGDGLARVVEWEDGSDVGAFAGKPVRLRFELKDANLYALKFGASEPGQH